MASTPQSLLDYYARVDHSTDPSELLSRKMARLDSIMDALRADVMAPWLRVFGSAVDKPDLMPGDIDVFLDLKDMPPPDRKVALYNLLELAVSGGYHGNYGLFDPFVLNAKGVLYCRNEASSRLSVGWQIAKDPEILITPGRAGVPLSDFNRQFQQEFADFTTASGIVRRI